MGRNERVKDDRNRWPKRFHDFSVRVTTGGVPGASRPLRYPLDRAAGAARPTIFYAAGRAPIACGGPSGRPPPRGRAR